MRIFTSYLLAGGLALVGARAASAQVLYDNFENTRLVSYPLVQGTLNQSAANPGNTTAGSTSINTSPTCASYARDGSQQYAVILVKPTNAVMADVTPYTSGTKKISVKFRSTAAGVQVQAVLQDGTKNTSSYPNGKYLGDFFATTTKAGDWETLTFAFTAAGAGQFDPTVTATGVNQLVLLVAPGTNTATTSYLDDIMGPELVASAPTPTPTPTPGTATLLDNFEGTRLLTYPAVQGTLNEAAANPGTNAVNMSSTCANYARDASQQYATISAQLKSGKFGDVTGFTTGAQTMSMKFRGPAAGIKVQLVLQNHAATAKTPYNYPQGNFGGTFDATTTQANAWETLTFTYTANAGGADATVKATDIDQIAMLLDFNSKNAGPYYFDDFTGPTPSTVTATRQVQTDAAALSAPYPNPAAGLAHLPFSLKQAATVSLALYDNLGRRAAQVLETQVLAAGEHAADLPTARLAPGLYTCRLTVDGAVLNRQLSVQ